MGHIIKIVNIVFLIIIIFILQLDDTALYDWAYIGSTWLLIDLIAEFIKDRYFVNDIFNQMKVKSYYDGSKHIEKKEYPKIISTIVIIIANSIIYFFTKADSLDNFISLISSILLTLLALAIFRGLIRIKNDSLIKKKD